MTDSVPRSPDPASLSWARRYAPVLGIVVVLAVIAIAVTVAGRGDDASPTASSTTGVRDESALPLTFDEATKAGSAAGIDWGPDCDPSTGRIKVPSIYAPPCVAPPAGDNGGATAPGVTADKIVIAYYVASLEGDLTAMFAGNTDSQDKVDATIQGYTEMFNRVFETYGRTVEIKRFDAKGGMSDAIGAAADAQAVIDQFHPFASINGPAITNVYAEELARNDVLCLNCGSAVPESTYLQLAPHLWGGGATGEQTLQFLVEYIDKRLTGRPAAFAGDALRDKPRSFGIVHFESDPPAFSGTTEAMQRCSSLIGGSPAVVESYTFDLARMAERAVTIVAKLKASGVTTVVFIGDPIMPIFLTKEATKQEWFPEWIVSGTAFTDTAVIARRYDQAQWQHAFGISQLPVLTPPEQREAWTMYEWGTGTTPPAVNTHAIVVPAIFQLFQGIHLAGPRLTAANFERGLFSLPPAGGGPTTLHVSYGDHGYFKAVDTNTCTYSIPQTDHVGTDDVTEIWWDGSSTEPDEQGQPGTGLYRYANQGKRYLPGTMPRTDVDAFEAEGSIIRLDEPLPDERPPSYPPPNAR